MGYKINKSYVLSGSQGDGRIAKKMYIIAHESGNQNDVKDPNAVLHEVQYMKAHYDAAYSTHFVGDGGQIYQIGTPGYVSWAALDANPYAPAQVELARTADKATFKKDYAAYIWILRTMAQKYGIPLTLDKSGKGIKSHKWVTNNYGGDHVDPYAYLAKWGISQSQFAHDLAHGLEPAKDDKPSYLHSGSEFKVKTAAINAYKDVALKTKAGKKVKKGATFKASVVKYGSITRLKGADGLYYSSNNDYVINIK